MYFKEIRQWIHTPFPSFYSIIHVKFLNFPFVVKAWTNRIFKKSSGCSLQPWPSDWTMVDQAYRWSWTSDSSSHHFAICLYRLHCPAPSADLQPLHLFSAHSSHCCHCLAHQHVVTCLSSPATQHPLHVQMGSVLWNWVWWQQSWKTLIFIITKESNSVQLLPSCF